jgi:hypothetical protein
VRTGEWLPLVWGRTREADRWWRVLPEDVEPDGWIADVASAAFVGGNDLQVPRFLLARVHDQWITGVACAAHDLDPSMAQDHNGRPLFTFVGWMADAAVPVVLPTLRDWHGEYVAWAGPTYSSWAARDWDKHRADVGPAALSTPEAVGWSEAGPTGSALDMSPGTAVEVDLDPHVLHLYPEADGEYVWTAVSSATTPFVLVTGWQNRTRLRDTRFLTHAVVAGLAERDVIEREAPADLCPPPAVVAPPPDATDAEGAEDEAVASDGFSVAAPAGHDGDGGEQPGRSRLFPRLPGMVNPRRVEALEHEVVQLHAELAAVRSELAALRAELERQSHPRQLPRPGGDR